MGWESILGHFGVGLPETLLSDFLVSFAFSSSLMALLANYLGDFSAEILQEVCRSLQKDVLLRQESVRKFCGKFADISKKISDEFLSLFLEFVRNFVWK